MIVLGKIGKIQEIADSVQQWHKKIWLSSINDGLKIKKSNFK
jgi:hypothetical protein